MRWLFALMAAPMLIGKGKWFFWGEVAMLFFGALTLFVWMAAPLAMAWAWGLNWSLPWLVPSTAVIMAFLLTRDRLEGG
ncbi:MAG: hypothetical protein JST30_03930 [Armatimonadetes bacterium]|nr:hypothetical protein [Armatimonadota bacterium]